MNIDQISKQTLKYGFLAYALWKDPLIGLGLIVYMVHQYNKMENLRNQLNCALEEDKQNKPLEKIKDIKGNVSKIDLYQDCVIENFQDRFYRILKPSGEYLEKIFTSLDEAKKEIDIVSPYLPKKKGERPRIYNIRYVK